MSTPNDLTTSVPVKATARVSHRPATHDKTKVTAVALGQGPFSLVPIANATPSFNTAAVAVYQPPGATVENIWAIWSQPGDDGTEATTLFSSTGSADGDDVDWSLAAAVKDTEGFHIESALSPSLAVLDGQMHLIVVKPDGRGTLAHYVYIDSAKAWEYNAGWVVQPQTTASPSVATVFTSNLLYLAFIVDEAVTVCTYTPSTAPGIKFGRWSEPAVTTIQSARAPALFTSPRLPNLHELHLVVASPDKLITEYTMGSSVEQWSLSSPQPAAGVTEGGVGACSKDPEAFLSAATADDENPGLQYAIWSEDVNAWSGWRKFGSDVGLPAVHSDVTCAVFNKLLHFFYIGPQNSGYNLWFVFISIH